MAAAVVVLSSLVQPVFAATIYVPGEYPTIQPGIDAAQPGDEVLVAPGV